MNVEVPEITPIPRPEWTPLPHAGCVNVEARVLLDGPPVHLAQLGSPRTARFTSTRPRSRST